MSNSHVSLATADPEIGPDDMESLQRIFMKRRSIRAYLRDKPKREDILEILDTARFAPNSCNLQHYGFIYIDDDDILKKMEGIATRKVSWAPSLIVIIDDKRFSQTRRAGLQSTAAATQNIVLAATAKGLGTCWMAGFYGDDGIRELLNIPEHYEVTGLMAIGYPDPDAAREETQRLQSENYIHFNGFEQKSIELLSDLNVDHWPMNKLTSYRERIGSVYASRNHIQIYQQGMVRDATKRYISLIKKHVASVPEKTISCIDIASYDGCFIREVKKQSSALPDGVELFTSDYSPYFTDIITQQLPGIGAVPMDREHMLEAIGDAPHAYDFMSHVFKIEYLPETEKLLKALRSRIKKDGRLFLASVPKYAPRAMAYRAESLVNGANMYEKNKHYRFGPYRHLSVAVMTRHIKKAGWTIEKSGSDGSWPKSNFKWFWLSP